MSRNNGLDELAAGMRRARRTGLQILQAELGMAECFLNLAATTVNDHARRRTVQRAARTVDVVSCLAQGMASPVQRALLLQRCDRLLRRLAGTSYPARVTAQIPPTTAGCRPGLKPDGRVRRSERPHEALPHTAAAASARDDRAAQHARRD